MPNWLRSRPNGLHLERRIEEDRQAREAEIAAVQARLGATASDNLRLTEERNQAEVVARELRIDLSERDRVVASLAIRLRTCLRPGRTRMKSPKICRRRYAISEDNWPASPVSLADWRQSGPDNIT